MKLNIVDGVVNIADIGICKMTENSIFIDISILHPKTMSSSLRFNITTIIVNVYINRD